MNKPIQLIKKPDQTEEEKKIFEKLRGKEFIAVYWDDKSCGYETTSENRRIVYYELMKTADIILNENEEES